MIADKKSRSNAAAESDPAAADLGARWSFCSPKHKRG